MRTTRFQRITPKLKAQWEKEKRKEWKGNSDFWIRVVQHELDPFRTHVTYPAILQALPKSRGQRILDAGCGEGSLARKIASKGFCVFGVDNSSELVEAAQKKQKRKKPTMAYKVADMRKTKFSDSFFDVVVSHQSIMELPDPEQALKEFARLLKRKGRLILLFLHPCFDFQKDPGELYFERGKIQKEHYLVSGIKSPRPYFYLHLPLEEWVSLLEDAGFSLLHIAEPHPTEKLFRQKWWKENFSKPRFILIEAEKK